ncbi:hypothetical protein LOC68_05565 [Blastopirellula sp. JC732]|uniref:DUF5666 domain-containing protein n=1 Tax=Blastopirellula sediminis TaxID=2894196 RepID=A0A9X1MKE4_9BACT|nr:hypothetical protein [Blastopirellula sediminis]MCC9609368.1 hypothetical protein [Blastopirellula sediminis]MCC9627855.1 hypothetical protein [Blastopirellula sediminis]
MLRTLGVFAILALAALPFIAQAQQQNGSPPPISAPEIDVVTDRASAQADEKRRRNRVREGTRITDSVGQFDWVGDRMNFVSDDGTQDFHVLENLAMERVAQSMEQSASKITWTVSGVVTEYRGSNYLLIEHVTLKGRRQ